MPIEVGVQAPDFVLKDQNNQEVRLADFQGNKTVLLVFYPLAFSGICSGELCQVRDNLNEYLSDDVQVLTVSVDSVYSHKVWAEQEGFQFPLLSDFWPHGAVSSDYEVFDEAKGSPRRSSYVVDRDGTLRWSVHNANPEGRDLEEHLRQLRSLV